ncbi:MAG: NAD(P)-binding domain-containing protein, partial [Alphaproteobacteria bacterium]|nr:NAD(P)-binding domain-containing protein [Alphaproteobacteria bacterium]
AVIGAGPVGLAAAAHLVQRGLTPLVLEAGPAVGHALRQWAHVQVFSPWRYNVDRAAAALLAETGWTMPDPDTLPTGGEIVRRYLEPLAAHPTLAPHIATGARVTAVTRRGIDKMTDAGRADAPFVLRWTAADGARSSEARAVIDASGTWFTPSPMGIDGLPVPGEDAAAERIVYGIPDIAGAARADYAGRRTLVVGSGHSAIGTVLDLLRLQQEAPGTRIFWALRRDRLDRVVGGGAADQLPARGALGLAAAEAIAAGRLTLLAPFAAKGITRDDGALRVAGRNGCRAQDVSVDRIVVATGFRPNTSLLRELRVALDPATEAPPALAPLIDPNLHSCGTVRPHGAAELAHPEPGLWVVGAKSYGRAPTFLMATGYEQVRSVTAAIAGDMAAARDVRLVLPETGVCSARPVEASRPIAVPLPAAATGGCCGPAVKVPEPAATACCAAAE